MQNKWMELFPTIVSMANTIKVISSGMLGGHSGALQLVHNELKTIIYLFFFKKN